MSKQAVEKQVGKTIDVTLTSDVSVGDIIPFDGMVAVAVNSGLVGETIAVEIEKVWTINAKTADVISLGNELYWDDTNNELTLTATDNTRAGKAMNEKAAVAGTIDLKLNA